MWWSSYMQNVMTKEWNNWYFCLHRVQPNELQYACNECYMMIPPAIGEWECE